MYTRVNRASSASPMLPSAGSIAVPSVIFTDCASAISVAAGRSVRTAPTSWPFAHTAVSRCCASVINGPSRSRSSGVRGIAAPTRVIRSRAAGVSRSPLETVGRVALEARPELRRGRSEVRGSEIPRAELALEHRRREVGLVVEVVVEGALAQPRRRQDPVERRALVAVLAELGDRCIEQRPLDAGSADETRSWRYILVETNWSEPAVRPERITVRGRRHRVSVVPAAGASVERVGSATGPRADQGPHDTHALRGRQAQLPRARMSTATRPRASSGRAQLRGDE